MSYPKSPKLNPILVPFSTKCAVFPTTPLGVYFPSNRVTLPYLPRKISAPPPLLKLLSSASGVANLGGGTKFVNCLTLDAAHFLLYKIDLFSRFMIFYSTLFSFLYRTIPDTIFSPFSFSNSSPIP